MSRPTVARWTGALLVAVVVATIWGTIVLAQFNINALNHMGAEIGFGLRLRTTFGDIFSAFSLVYGGLFVLPSLLVGFALAGWLRRRMAGSAPFWFSVAGGLAILAVIPLVNQGAPVALLVVASREIACLVLMAVGGVFAGMAFAGLATRRAA